MKDRIVFQKLVGPQSNEKFKFIPDSGQIIRITECFGAATFNSNTYIEIIWDKSGDDKEVIFMTYGTGQRVNMRREFIGDGTTAITIKLVNNSTIPTMLLGDFFYTISSGLS